MLAVRNSDAYNDYLKNYLLPLGQKMLIVRTSDYIIGHYTVLFLSVMVPIAAKAGTQIS